MTIRNKNTYLNIKISKKAVGIFALLHETFHISETIGRDTTAIPITASVLNT